MIISRNFRPWHHITWRCVNNSRAACISYSRAFYASNESKSHLSATSRVHKDEIFASSPQSHDSREISLDVYAESSLIQEIQLLEDKARVLTNLSDFNMNSHKQVSQFIFGHDQNMSVNQKVLNDFLKQTASIVSDKENRLVLVQRDLASIVLEYRRLKSTKNAMTGANMSTVKSSMSSYTNSRAYYTKSSISTEDSKDVLETFEEDIFENSNGNGILERKNPKLNWDGFGTESSYREYLDSIFTNKTKVSCSIHPVWNDALLSIRKPSARILIYQLDPNCPMGFSAPSPSASKKSTLLSFVRQEKQKHPDHLILTRVGEFYETYGVDAIMLVEHCGLNAMGGKARAGCPVQNLQATLNCLIPAGFRVAVYEESDDVVTTGQIKNRFLSQFVSSSNPTYMYNSILDDSGKTSDNLFGTPYARPHIGVINTAAGYIIVEISLEEQKVRVTERLTAEAVACQLSNNPPADPLFYVPSPLEGKVRSKLPFLPSWWRNEKDVSHSYKRVSILRPSVHLAQPSDCTSDVERAKDAILNHLLKATELYEQGEKGLNSKNFTLISPSMWSNGYNIETSPLYVDTASQLGLMNVPTIPSLHKYLLSDNSPAICSKFLKRWLLTPPPSSVASSMSQLVKCLKDTSDFILPEFDLAPIGKVLQYIRAGEAGAQVFCEVVKSLKSTVEVINACYKNDRYVENILKPWMKILRFESGLDATPLDLKNRCLDAIQIIEAVVDIGNLDSFIVDFDVDVNVDTPEVIPSKFFYNNEKTWKGRVKQEAALDAYKSVEDTRLNLIDAIAVDFCGVSSGVDISKANISPNSICYDVSNNIMNLKLIPPWANRRELYYHPRDRNGKVVHNRYITRRVEDALSKYVDACHEATKAVRRKLKELSMVLCDTGHLPSISQSAHSNLILATVHNHCKHANVLGWSMAEVFYQNSDNKCSTFHFDQLTPYWMDRSVAISNTFDLNGMVFLSSPNMAGKSTIMRSAAAAALLSVCGFCSPVGPGTKIKKFDHLFVRGASADVPSENKSAFGAEMGDVAALLRVCGNNSLVFVDELGRGTSPRDGTSLAAALLESMAEKGMTGFFATHLHSIVDLPLSDNAQRNIVNKQMQTTECGEEWTYKLIDGICRDSKALKTASKFGIPKQIISRAKVLAQYMDESATSSSMIFNNLLLSKPPLNDNSRRLHDNLFRAKEMVQMVAEQEPIVIHPNFSVPAAYEGCSCVYVLHSGSSFYIGETDHISHRIRKHRQMKEFRNATLMIVKILHGKTESRNIESRLIQRFVQDGLDVWSKKDGISISPSQLKD